MPSTRFPRKERDDSLIKRERLDDSADDIISYLKSSPEKQKETDKNLSFSPEKILRKFRNAGGPDYNSLKELVKKKIEVEFKTNHSEKEFCLKLFNSIVQKVENTSVLTKDVSKTPYAPRSATPGSAPSRSVTPGSAAGGSVTPRSATPGSVTPGSVVRIMRCGNQKPPVSPLALDDLKAPNR